MEGGVRNAAHSRQTGVVREEESGERIKTERQTEEQRDRRIFKAMNQISEEQEMSGMFQLSNQSNDTVISLHTDSEHFLFSTEENRNLL